MIRRIQHSDVEYVVNLSEKFYDEMGFDEYGFRFDKAHITQGFHRSADMDGCLCLVCEEGAMIIGVIFFTLSQQTWYFKNRIIATEIVWHSDPILPPLKRMKVMRQLMTTALDELKKIGCKVVASSAPSHETSVVKLLEKAGFSFPQTYLMKEI